MMQRNFVDLICTALFPPSQTATSLCMELRVPFNYAASDTSISHAVSCAPGKAGIKAVSYLLARQSANRHFQPLEP